MAGTPGVFASLSGVVLGSSLLLAASAAVAQVVVVPAKPLVGSSNPVSAEPLVKRPKTTPCVVPLLTNQAFADYSGKPLLYTPPAGCPGPWAKVVFTADFTVTAGRQYDRTAEFYLGNASIFYGTTAEPRRTLSPSWHVERDLTDLTALFKTAQVGQAEIGNTVNANYTGIIYGSAALEFYPVAGGGKGPLVPDAVLPITTGNDAGTLNTGTSVITQTLSLPRNVEKAYLDVIAQSQSTDEFWYLCVPNDQATTLESCGNTAFRETEVTIDGKPAGVAPVYPWIYTGGIDPYLWEPVTGVQTLNFKPYRVDLTPFAGLLSNGEPHTIGVSVYNANSYFLATANLLLYEDHGWAQVVGGVLKNNLMPPSPTVAEAISTDPNGITTGTVTVGSSRKFTISGFLDTSHGRVETTVKQTVSFLSAQTFNVNQNTGAEVQDVAQSSTVDSVTTTEDGSGATTDATHLSYPLTLHYSYAINPDGTQTQVVTSDQTNLLAETQGVNGLSVYANNVQEEVNSMDTLQFDASGALTAPGIGKTTAVYRSFDSKGNCYSRALMAANQVLTSVEDGLGCR